MLLQTKKSEKHKYTTHEQTQKKKSHPIHRRRIFLFLGFSDASLGREVVTARKSAQNDVPAKCSCSDEKLNVFSCPT